MIKYIILMIVLCSSLVLAYNPYDPFAKVEYGQNISLKLYPSSRQNIKIYEGSAVQFSVYTPKNAIRSYNNIIIKEIGQEETKALLSVKGIKYEEISLKLGQDYKVDFNGSIPFMFIKEDTLHYEDNPRNRYIVLYFNVPQFQVEKKDLPTGEVVIDLQDVEGISGRNKIFTPIRVILIGLGLASIIGTFFLFKKAEQH